MLKIVGLIVVLSLIGAAIYYFVFYKRGKINDRDGDYIPDVVEDTIEEVKEKTAEVKRRVKAVREEVKDVVAAAKGKKRRGRKPKSKK